MPTHSSLGAAYELELRPGSPALAEELVAVGVPIEALPGLGPNEKSVMRLALNPHSGSAQAAAELLAGLRNINVRADTPPWLRAEAVRSIVAHSRCSFEPDPPNPFEPNPRRFWLSEGGPVVIPSSGDGQKKVDNGLPIQKLDDGLIFAFDIPPWLLGWETFLLAVLPYRMREIFRIDDFYLPPMSREAPAGLLSLNYRYAEGDEGFEFQDALPDIWSGSTAAAALIDVFHSELELDATERLFYLVAAEGNATPQDLGLSFGITADAARMRRERLFEKVAKAAQESEVLKLVDSDLIWQPEGRPGPYDENTREEVFQLFESQRRRWKSWSWRTSFGHWPQLAEAYEPSDAAKLLLGHHSGAPSPNSTLYRYGGGKPLDELGRRAWTEPAFGPLEREPMSEDVYSDPGRLVAEGCDRKWKPEGSLKRRDISQPSNLAPRPRSNSASAAQAPSRNYKPRCLERGCSLRASAVYESRTVPLVNSETQPHWLQEPREKTDANRYCERHLQERKEPANVIEADIAALDSRPSSFQEETRRGISSMLTALTWKFPDHEELLDAVDDWRHQIGDIGVQVLADE